MAEGIGMAKIRPDENDDASDANGQADLAAAMDARTPIMWQIATMRSARFSV